MVIHQLPPDAAVRTVGAENTFHVAKNSPLRRRGFADRGLLNGSRTPWHGIQVARPDEAVEGLQAQTAVQQALSELDDEHRELVVLRDIENMTYEEIQQITGLPEGTVKSRLHRARLALQAALDLRRAGAPDERVAGFLAPLEVAYREARQAAPGLAEIEYYLGRFQRVLDREHEALASQRRALAKDPHFVPALYEYAAILSLRHERALKSSLSSAPSASGPPTSSRRRSCHGR